MKGYYATPILPLARGKVRYVGEPIVGVVAESRYLAEDAAELIEIEFEPLPAPPIRPRPRAPDAPLLHEEAGTNVLVAREFKRGDVDAAMAAAPVRVGGRFRMRRKTADGDRAARVPGRIRRRPRRAHAAFGDADPRHHPRCARRGARPARAPAARGRARRRRRLRRQGLALSGGDLRLRARRARLGRAGEMDQRPHGGPGRHQPGLRRDRRRRAGARPRRHACWRCAPT